MNQLPTKEAMREMVAPLDDLDRKVLGGLVAIWMVQPDKIKDREWTAQHFLHVATVAHGFDEDSGPATDEDVERIRCYAAEHMEPVLRVGFALFVRVANDMQDLEGGFSYENAQESVRSYLEVPPAASE